MVNKIILMRQESIKINNYRFYKKIPDPSVSIKAIKIIDVS